MEILTLADLGCQDIGQEKGVHKLQKVEKTFPERLAKAVLSGGAPRREASRPSVKQDRDSPKNQV